jgi:hypothetical protein
VASYLCTIPRKNAWYWQLSKEVGMWGVPIGRNRNTPYADIGDGLLIWVGGRGYVAEATVVGPPEPPTGVENAPWPGGTYNFELIVPMTVVTEVRQGIYLPFVGDVQRDTGFSKAMFRRSFVRIPDPVFGRITRALASRALEEQRSAPSVGV